MEKVGEGKKRDEVAGMKPLRELGTMTGHRYLNH